MIPTVAPTIEIEILGEKHVLKFGFRAYQEIGMNPFDPKSIEEFGKTPRTCRDLAAQIRAGMLHEYYGRQATRKGQEPPSVEDVMDELDPISYVDIWQKIQKVMGTDTEAPKPADPPAA